MTCDVNNSSFTKLNNQMEPKFFLHTMTYILEGSNHLYRFRNLSPLLLSILMIQRIAYIEHYPCRIPCSTRKILVLLWNSNVNKIISDVLWINRKCELSMTDDSNGLIAQTVCFWRICLWIAAWMRLLQMILKVPKQTPGCRKHVYYHFS